MTEHRPPTCHYTPGLGRVTRDHRDTCTTTTCTGCAPCTAPHCQVCGHRHATNDHPQTCPTCIGVVRADLDDLDAAFVDLATEALDAGRDGRLAAAAPIPGGIAQVLAGPSTPPPALLYSRTLLEDHPINHRTGRPVDPMPPLAVLGQWDAVYRRHLGHTSSTRRTVSTVVAYLRGQLDHVAQDTTGPDFPEFTRQVRTLRADLERALHNEREPEVGVSCFECGGQLVRRFRDAAACRHQTPARRELARWLQAGYPEALTVSDVREARRPCGACDQGGIRDPRAGLSWECPGCRKSYDPGEYATAVRRDLLDNAGAGDGWTHVSMAAEAASTLTGMVVQATTVRKWMDRGRVAACCLWEAGRPWGTRLVFWPDVADLAVELADRQRRRALAGRAS